MEAGITKGEVVHVDATLIRADADWESLVDCHAGAAAENGDAEGGVGTDAPLGGKRKKAGVTYPDASMAGRRLEPSCKQHAAVDEGNGVVPDVAAATGEVNEGNVIEAQVDEVRRISGKGIGIVTADAGCACGGLERRGIDPAIPAKREPAGSRVPTRRFRHDERNDIVKCPPGKVLRPGRPLKGDCVSRSRSRKAMEVGTDHPALLRARRRHLRWSEEDRRLHEHHRWRSEGFHGEAKTWHGPRRAVRLGQHEGPVLPDGRRDQLEAARGRSLHPIPCRRHDLSARNASFRVPSGMIQTNDTLFAVRR